MAEKNGQSFGDCFLSIILSAFTAPYIHKFYRKEKARIYRAFLLEQIMPKKKNELGPVPKNDFEVIAIKEGFKIDKGHSGEYLHFETNYAWKGWKMFQKHAINTLEEVLGEQDV